MKPQMKAIVRAWTLAMTAMLFSIATSLLFALIMKTVVLAAFATRTKISSNTYFNSETLYE